MRLKFENAETRVGNEGKGLTAPGPESPCFCIEKIDGAGTFDLGFSLLGETLYTRKIEQ